MNSVAILSLILLIIFSIMILKMISIVPQGQKWIIETLGKFDCVWEAGLHFRKPFIQTIRNKVNQAEHTLTFATTAVMTKDRAPVNISGSLNYVASDPVKFTYGIKDPKQSIKDSCAQELNKIVGNIDAEECNAMKEIINRQLKDALSENTDKWGISIQQVSLKEIQIPEESRRLIESRSRDEQKDDPEKLEATRKQGRDEGRLLMLSELVNSGDLTSEQATEKAGMDSYGAFLCAVNKLR